MKKIVILFSMLFFLMNGITFANSSSKTMSGKYENIKIRVLIDKMHKDYGFDYIINQSNNLGDKVVSISYNDKTWIEVIDSLARNYNFSWILKHNTAVMGPKGSVDDIREFKVNDIDKAKQLVSMVISDKKISVSKIDSSILVCASHEDMSIIEHLLSNV